MTLLVPKMGARHTWDGAVTLGDPTVWPRYRITQIQGLGSLGEREDNRDPAYGRLGEIPRRSPRRGKTITYTGYVLGRTFGEMRLGESLLLDAFADTTEARMDIQAPLDSAQPDMFFMGGAQACDIIDQQTDGSTGGFWQRQFVLAVRMSDPRVYEAAIQVVTVSSTPLLGLTLPQTLPFTTPSQTVPSAAVLNGGSAPTDPVISLPGPFNSPTVMNFTTGLQLALPGAAVSAGDTMLIDFRGRVVSLNGQGDMTSFVDFEQSDWWDIDAPGLVKGENVIHASAGGAPLPVTVSFYPASWG